MIGSRDQAWNNFVLNSDPGSDSGDRSRQAAALANLYMGLANNGGLLHFLEASNDFAAQDVLDALHNIGAGIAAAELKIVLDRLGEPLPASSQHSRSAALDRLWTDDLDKMDVLSQEADDELMRVLTSHVDGQENYYLSLR